MSKKRFFKKSIVICSIIIIPFLLMFTMNKIYNATSSDIIKIVIYPDDSSSKTHYVEVNPNGTITATVGTRKDYKVDISNFFFLINFNFSEKQNTKLSKEEINEIFNLADKTISYGNIRDRAIVFGGYHCDVYYKGFSHKIRISNEGYYDLYMMLNKIDNSLPNPIKLNTMIPDIDDETEWGV